MAEKKTTSDMVTVVLPRDPNPNAPQQEFYSVNFKNYMVKRGVPVEVPKALYEAIINSENAENYAIDYAQSQTLHE